MAPPPLLLAPALTARTATTSLDNPAELEVAASFCAGSCTPQLGKSLMTQQGCATTSPIRCSALGRSGVMKQVCASQSPVTHSVSSMHHSDVDVTIHQWYLQHQTELPALYPSPAVRVRQRGPCPLLASAVPCAAPASRREHNRNHTTALLGGINVTHPFLQDACCNLAAIHTL